MSPGRRTPRLRRRGSPLIGAAVAVGAVGLAAVAVYALERHDTPTISNAYVPSLEAALSSVPDHDVPGADVTGLPRPAGSTRSFVQVRGTTTLLVYSRRAALDEVIAGLRTALPAAGWSKIGADGRVPSEVESWVALYTMGSTVVNVSVTTAKGVTAATYVAKVA